MMNPRAILIMWFLTMLLVAALVVGTVTYVIGVLVTMTLYTIYAMLP